MSFFPVVRLLLRKKSYEEWLQLLVFYPGAVPIILGVLYTTLPTIVVLTIFNMLVLPFEVWLSLILIVLVIIVHPIVLMAIYLICGNFGSLERYFPFICSIIRLHDHSPMPASIGRLPIGMTRVDVQENSYITDTNENIVFASFIVISLCFMYTFLSPC